VTANFETSKVPRRKISRLENGVGAKEILSWVGLAFILTSTDIVHNSFRLDLLKKNEKKKKINKFENI
jgi:hypothetical protein